MLEIDIPGFGLMKLEHLLCDYTGTLSIDGKIIPGVRERLNILARILSVHVVTADTFGTAQAELAGINCAVLVVSGKDIDSQKEIYEKILAGKRLSLSVMEIMTGRCLKFPALALRSLKRKGAQLMPSWQQMSL
jgi:soluble P-type ATPase